MLTHDLRPYRRLVAAVVLRALKDGAGNGPQGVAARIFLSSETAADYISLTGLDARELAAWIERGCPRRDPIRLLK